MIYCVDTSSLIAAWQERYPIENFPKFWDRVDGLVKEKRLVSPMEVFLETKKRSDELHGWLKARKADLFLELDDAVQTEVASVLSRFPRLVGEKKLNTSADPFVIALALVQGVPVVTEEKLTGNERKPHIPDVCAALGVECKNLLDMIRSEKWIVG
jgi:Domain of unknown function (DUF4411)